MTNAEVAMMLESAQQITSIRVYFTDFTQPLARHRQRDFDSFFEAINWADEQMDKTNEGRYVIRGPFPGGTILAQGVQV